MSVTKKQIADRNGTGELIPAAPAASPENISIVIPRIQKKIIAVEVEGITPLVVCQWSIKALRQMQDQMEGKQQIKKRDKKDPEAEYLASIYKCSEGWTGVPAGGVKGCIVAACRLVVGLPMTMAKRMCFVREDGMSEQGQGLVRIYGDHFRHTGPVRLPNGSVDLRSRAMYEKWSLKLQIEYHANIISAEQLLNLLELAGDSEGLCEHRPGAPKSNTGNWGRFTIKRGD